MFHVILYQPEIPPNTGNIIRLCANTGCRLHLIKPLGFTLENKQLLRAGLDYHEFAQLRVHDTLTDCLQTLPVATALPHPNPDETTDMTASHLTDETTSHSTKPPKNGGKVAGYNPASEKLLAGHPKDAGQVIDETTSHLTKAASCQVIGYGYSHSTKPASGQVAGYPPEGEGANVSLRELIATRRVFALTTKGAQAFHQVCYRPGDAFLFGPESRGLPAEVLAGFDGNQRVRLPMLPENRSLNLSNTVAVAVFEAWRQCGFEGAKSQD